MTHMFLHSCRILLLLTTWQTAVQAQGIFDFERKPIDYHSLSANNLVTQLQDKINAGEAELIFKRPRGYLDSFLKQLDISTSTQTLVYSKTSVQLHWITPARPRALYFNEAAYVGWVPGGDVLEIIVTDPQLGTAFYTLQQRPTQTPRFHKDTGQCLQCHATRRTQEVPGPVVRSLFTQSDGVPIYRFGNFTSDHTSPFSQRWGGYYVTGTHGATLHMGNMLIQRDTPYEDLNYESGANLTDLSSRFDTRPYPNPHSDIVALMVLEHQSQLQNLLTKARFEEIRGNSYDNTFSDKDNSPSPATRRRVTRAGEALLKYMLFVDEYQLSAPVSGTSGFTAEFSAKGPHDRHGRSLYQLDLKTRLMKYPLSYMIYTQAFRQLPPMIKTYISHRLREILTASSTDDDFDHLDLKSRRDILDILKETHPDLAGSW